MATSRDRLAGSDKVPIGLALQPVLSDRVNVLLTWARARSRPNWNRRDVVAALVFNSPTDADDFERLMTRYERATVADARLRGQPTMSPSTRQPGRVARPRKG